MPTIFKTPIKVFDHTRKVNPEKIALAFFKELAQDLGELHTLTYEELDTVVNRIATYLQTLQLAKNSALGVCFPPGPEFIIWMLGLWRAGFAYLPFAWRDKDSDQANIERIRSNLNRVNSDYIITSKEYLTKFKELPLNFKIKYHENIIETKPQTISVSEPNPAETAYYICSSGTTGTPKMIAVPYEGVVERIACHIDRMKMSSKDNVLALLDFEFDASIVEALMALMAGSTLVIAPRIVRSLQYSLPKFFQHCYQERIPVSTTIFLPSLLDHFKQQKYQTGDFPGLCRSITTGEACRKELLTLLQIDFFNGFGPTETTFGVSLTKIEPDQAISIHDVMYGLVLLHLKENENQKFYLTANNEVGEIFIAGRGLAHYVGNDQLQEKYFLRAEQYLSAEALKFYNLDPSCIIYRSFDLARKADGLLIYLYRKDGILKRGGKQVSILDLENEIQTELNDYCDQVIVTPIDRNKGTFAVFLKRKTNLSENLNNAVSALKKKLSFYKRPNIWYLLNENANLKTDRGKIQRSYIVLEKMAQPLQLQQKNSQQKLTLTEERIADTWKYILQIDSINFDNEHNFINDLGGTSLQIATMLNLVWRKLIDSNTPAPVSIFQYFQDNAILEYLACFVDCYHSITLKPLTSVTQSKLNIFLLDNKIPPATQQMLITSKHFNCWLVEAFDGKNLIAAAYVAQHKINMLQLTNGYQLLCSDEKILCIAKEMPALTQQLQCIEIIEVNSEKSPEDLQHQLIEAAQRQIKQQLILHLGQLQQQNLKKLPSANQFYSTQQMLYQALKDFIQNSKKQIFWLIGNVGSGKSLLCHKLLAEEEKRHVIYLSLKDYQQAGDIVRLLKAQGFTDAELNLLKTSKVLLLFEDYDLIERFDFPNLWETEKLGDWLDIKMVITCRSWYMADNYHCWQTWHASDLQRETLDYPASDELTSAYSTNTVKLARAHFGIASPLVLSLTQQLLENSNVANELDDTNFKLDFCRLWLKREMQRSGTKIIEFSKAYNRFIQDLERIAQQSPLSLQLQPSSWQLGIPTPNIITRNSIGFNQLAGLLNLRRAFGDGALIMEIAPTWRTTLKQKIFSKKLLQISSEIEEIPRNELVDLSESESLNTIQLGTNCKPIFAFAPLSGELPRAYQKLAEHLGPHQPFYCFVLSQSGPDRTTNLRKRINHYVDQITKKYPNSKDLRQELIIVGYSFGFIQAYAAACELKQRGYQIALLIDLDCPSPEDIDPLQYDHQSLRVVITKLIELYTKYLSKATQTLLQEKLNALDIQSPPEVYFQTVRNNITDNEEKSKFLPVLANSELNWGIYVQAKQWFKPSQQSFPITSFVAQERNPALNTHATYDWAQYCSQYTRIDVPGDHFSLFTENLFQQAVTQIQAVQIPIFTGSFNERIHCYLTEQEKQLPKIKHYLDLIVMNDNEESINLSEWQKNFIADPNQQTAVLLGEPGAGKTTALIHFAQYVRSQLTTGETQLYWIPFFVSLNQQKSIDISAILSAAKISATEIDTKKWGLVFLFDAFDEMAIPQNLPESLKTLGCRYKIFISCRSYYYQQVKYNNFFGNHVSLNLQPLKPEQIDAYLNDACTPEDKQLMLKFQDLISNPLLLVISLLVIDKLKQYSSTKICKTILYDLLVEKIFNEYSQRIVNQPGIRPGINLQKMFIGFINSLAIDLWLLQQNKVPLNDMSVYQANDVDTQFSRRPNLVTQQQNKWAFIHPTFVEYFVACQLTSELEACEDSFRESRLYLFTIISLKQKIVLLDFLSEKLQQKNLIKEIVHVLMNIIMLSSRNERYFMAAGNVITLLNKLNIPFSGLNLSNTHIIGGDFSGAILVDTQCENTTFVDCDFNNTLLGRTNFSGAKLEGCNFGELPQVKLPKSHVFSHYISSNQTWLVISSNGDEESPGSSNNHANLAIELWNLVNQCFAQITLTPQATYLHAEYDEKNSQVWLLIKENEQFQLLTYNIANTQLQQQYSRLIKVACRDFLITPAYILILNENKKEIIIKNRSDASPRESVQTYVFNSEVTKWIYSNDKNQVMVVSPTDTHALQIIDLSAMRLTGVPNINDLKNSLLNAFQYCIAPNISSVAVLTKQELVLYDLDNMERKLFDSIDEDIMDYDFNPDPIEHQLCFNKDAKKLIWWCHELMQTNCKTWARVFSVANQHEEDTNFFDDIIIFERFINDIQFQAMKIPSVTSSELDSEPESLSLIVTHLSDYTNRQLLFPQNSVAVQGDSSTLYGEINLTFYANTMQILCVKSITMERIYNSILLEREITDQDHVNTIQLIDENTLLISICTPGKIDDEQQKRRDLIIIKYNISTNIHKLLLLEGMGSYRGTTDKTYTNVKFCKELQCIFVGGDSSNYEGLNRICIYDINLEFITYHNLKSILHFEIIYEGCYLVVCSLEQLDIFSIQADGFIIQRIQAYNIPFIDRDWKNSSESSCTLSWNPDQKILKCSRYPRDSYWRLSAIGDSLLSSQLYAADGISERYQLTCYDLNLKNILTCTALYLLQQKNTSSRCKPAPITSLITLENITAISVKNNLTHLPSEIWVQLISYLSYADQLSLATICTAMRALSQNIHLRKYGIFLTTSVVAQVKELLLRNYQYACLNVSAETPPTDIQIKPAKVATDLVRISIFGNTRKSLLAPVSSVAHFIKPTPT